MQISNSLLAKKYPKQEKLYPKFIYCLTNMISLHPLFNMQASMLGQDHLIRTKESFEDLLRNQIPLPVAATFNTQKSRSKSERDFLYQLISKRFISEITLPKLPIQYHW